MNKFKLFNINRLSPHLIKGANRSFTLNRNRYYSKKVLFFGSGDVALESAKLLHKNPSLIDKLQFVCPHQKSSRTPIHVREFAKANNIHVHTYNPDSVKDIEEIAKDFDLGVVVDFGYLIPSSILNSFKNTSLLMHPSLLPKYRGASPIEYALINGDTETGITVLEVHPTCFDKGKILYQEKYDIRPNETIVTLRNFLAVKGAEGLIKCLENYEEYLSKAYEQDDSLVKKAPKLQKNDYIADFENSKSLQLYNRWRGLSRLNTTLWGCEYIKSTVNDEYIHVILHEILLGSPSNEITHLKSPGQLYYEKPSKTLWIKTIDGWIGVKKLQIEGKKVISAEDFNNATKVNNHPNQYFKSVF